MIHDCDDAEYLHFQTRAATDLVYYQTFVTASVVLDSFYIGVSLRKVLEWFVARAHVCVCVNSFIFSSYLAKEYEYFLPVFIQV